MVGGKKGPLPKRTGEERLSSLREKVAKLSRLVKRNLGEEGEDPEETIRREGMVKGERVG